MIPVLLLTAIGLLFVAYALWDHPGMRSSTPIKIGALGAVLLLVSVWLVVEPIVGLVHEISVNRERVRINQPLRF